MDPAQQPVQGNVNVDTGKFEVQRVVPGAYMLYAQMRPTTPPAGGPRKFSGRRNLWKFVSVDVEDVALGAMPGIAMDGTIALEDKTATPAPSLRAFSSECGRILSGTETQPSPGTQTGADGVFNFAGVIPGMYRVYVLPWLLPNNPGLLAGLPANGAGGKRPESLCEVY
jgi:hypothetical protein